VSAVRRNKRKKAATLDELPLLGARQMAKLFGVSEATFSGWAADGIIERRGLDGYDLLEVIPRIYKDQRSRAQGRGEASQQHALTAARTAEMTARARLIQGRVEVHERNHWPIERVYHEIESLAFVTLEIYKGLAGYICNRLGLVDHEARIAISETVDAAHDDVRELVYEKLGEIASELTQAAIEGRSLGVVEKPKRGNGQRIEGVDDILDFSDVR